MSRLLWPQVPPSSALKISVKPPRLEIWRFSLQQRQHLQLCSPPTLWFYYELRVYCEAVCQSQHELNEWLEWQKLIRETSNILVHGEICASLPIYIFHTDFAHQWLQLGKQILILIILNPFFLGVTESHFLHLKASWRKTNKRKAKLKTIIKSQNVVTLLNIDNNILEIAHFYLTNCTCVHATCLIYDLSILSIFNTYSLEFAV